jgi:hypothetical protein
MPHAELDVYVYIHEVIADVMQALRDLAAQMNATAAISRRSAAGDLSATDTQDLIAATSSEQGKLALLRELLVFEEAGLENLGH